MKKYVCLVSLLSGVFAFNAAAKQIQVTASGFTFSPSTFTASIGDTIRFVWGDGMHTTTSTSVPPDAATWNAPLDITHTTFLYVIKVGGSYAFQCNFHAALGMVGSFKVPPRTKVTVVKTSVFNNCSNTNSIEYRCTQSTPPFKVQLFRYGIAFGTVRTVLDTLPFTYSSLPVGSYYATARGNNGTDVLVGKSSTKPLVPTPTGVFDTHVTSTKATIKWNHYTCVKFYSVQYRVKGATTWIKINTVGNKDSLNLSGLLVSTKYQFHVAANDSANKIIATGKYSAVDSFVTAASGILVVNEAQSLAVTDEGRVQKAVQVFPNPAASSFTIQTNGNQFKAIELLNTSGHIVWSEARADALNGGKLEVNVSSLPAGLYLLQLHDANGGVVVQKIVIAR